MIGHAYTKHILNHQTLFQMWLNIFQSYATSLYSLLPAMYESLSYSIFGISTLGTVILFKLAIMIMCIIPHTYGLNLHFTPDR